MQIAGTDGVVRERSLNQLSGGQWRRASLALELAFAELARQRCRISCSLIVMDEVLSQVQLSLGVPVQSASMNCRARANRVTGCV